MKVDTTSYRKDGYLLLKNFFRKEDVQRILSDARGVFLRQFISHGYVPSGTETLPDEQTFNDHLYRLFREDFESVANCGKQAQHLISLHSLSLSTQVQELLRSVGLASPVVSTRPVLFFNHPNLAKEKVYHTVDSHQDWRSMQGSLNSVVIWLPLVDIPRELGALEVLPGSHLAGLRTDRIQNGFGMVALTEEEQRSMVSVEVEVGDALLFSSFLIHQSGRNITDRPRWSCHFRYNDLDESTFIQRKFAHPYLYKPMDDLITPDFPAPGQVQNLFSK